MNNNILFSNKFTWCFHKQNYYMFYRHERRTDRLYRHALPHTILSNAPAGEVPFSKMDALGEHESQAEIFQDSTILYLHCVDTQYPLQLKIAGLPLLRMEGYFCHFSFMNSLSNRRICILPNSAELLRKVDGVNSPCIINVTSSVVFKVSYILFTVLVRNK